MCQLAKRTVNNGKLLFCGALCLLLTVESSVQRRLDRRISAAVGFGLLSSGRRLWYSCAPVRQAGKIKPLIKRAVMCICRTILSISKYGVTMEATVKWVDGAKFEATSGSGHTVILDGPPDHGGLNQGP